MKNLKNSSQMYFNMIAIYFCFSFFSEALVVIANVSSKIMIGYKISIIIIVGMMLIYQMHKSPILKDISFLIFLIVLALNVLSTIIAYKRYNLIWARGIIDFCVVILNSLIFYFLIKEKNIAKENLVLFLIFIFAVIVGSAVYNVIANYDIIGKIFSTSGTSYTYQTTSIFGNRNTFATYLFLGIVIGTLISTIKKNKVVVSIVIMLGIALLAFNLLLTMSRTAVLGIVVFAVVLLLFNKKISLIQKVILIVLIILMLAIIKSTVLWVYITEKLVRRKVGATGRRAIWLKSMLLNNNIFEILFGLGYGVASLRFKIATGKVWMHNIFLEFYNFGGIILLSLIMYLIFNSIIKAIKIRDKQTSLVILSFQLSTMVCMFFENYNFLATPAHAQLIYFIMITLPIIMNTFDNNKVKDLCNNVKYLAIPESIGITSTAKLT